MVTRKTKIPKTVFFTPKEQMALDALIEGGNYARASKILRGNGERISIGALRVMTLRIRNRYMNAKSFVELVDRYQTALRRKDRKKVYLTGPM